VYLVLLTARTAREHLVTGLASGADDYVLKPFDPIELQLRVRTGQRIVELQHELLAARQELERRANHDALTGAANRGAVLSKVEGEAARSARQGTHYCLILFDLDFFKRINDSHGHRAGDIVLKEAVRRAQIELRPYDVLGRYGGEEFMVLLPGCELRAGAVVAERLRKCIADQPFEIDKLSIDVTASFGIVCSSQPHSSLEMLVDAADSALYRAKANGRNRIELASDRTYLKCREAVLKFLYERHRFVEAAE
jgi:diguanylate cyclase (GGDEF)-like protein